MATLHHPPTTTNRLARSSLARALTVAFGFFLAAHGVVHVLGFLVQWKIATFGNLPYHTTLLSGHLDLGSTGIRLEGLLWLPPILGFAAGAVALVLHRRWWRPVVLWTSVFSLIVCALGWPQARVGVYVDLGILVVLALGMVFHSQADARQGREG